jgi:hypothetical protein
LNRCLNEGEHVRIRNVKFNGRKAWELDNDALSLMMTVGGGHIASLSLRGRQNVNPLWVPPWPSIEPWNYPKRRKVAREQRLLASILGHNLCLGWFGGPSDDEFRQGLECHGEAPIARWQLLGKSVTRRSLSMTCECILPVAEMHFIRTLNTQKGSNVIDVKEQIRSFSLRDQPFTMAEHVTLGPPFLEKGVTLFDMPATRCHTLPQKSREKQRLKANTAFAWPKGPGVNGQKVDMRMIGREYKTSSDYTANLMDPRKEDAWFAAVNPKLGLMLAYVWRRVDFPWIGNWEENYARKQKPWAGKALTRGMELANTPFPTALRNAVSMGTFHGLPTYRWLPAKGEIELEYSIIYAAIPTDVLGVKNITRSRGGFGIDLLR